jgi:hypothetical protein
MDNDDSKHTDIDPKILAFIEEKLNTKITEYEQAYESKLTGQKQYYDAKIEELDSKLNDMKSVVDNLVDPRLNYWNTGEVSSAGSKSDTRSEISVKILEKKNVRKFGVCMGCKGNGRLFGGLSIAHIVADLGSSKRSTSYGDFGESSGYVDDIDPGCGLNYLLLCGALGKAGSCHNEYDSLKMSLYWDHRDDLYKWFTPHSSTFTGGCPPPGCSVSTTVWTTAEIGEKYTRLLAWRTMRTVLQPGVAAFATVGERSQFIDFLKETEVQEFY